MYNLRKISFSKKLFTLILPVLGMSFAGFSSETLAQDGAGDNDQAWEGFYLGGEAGYARADDNGLLFGSSDGAYFGGYLGYRAQKNKLVFGIEGYGGTTTNDATVTVMTVPVTIDVGRIYGFDGVLGYAVNDKVLVFTTVGYVNVQIKGTSVAAPGLVVTDSSGDVRFGAGVEVKVSSKISARLKATYAEIGNLDILTVLGGITYNF